MTELLTIEQIAKKLGTSKRFVRNLVYERSKIRRKEIRGIPYKGFNFEDIVNFIQSQKKT